MRGCTGYALQGKSNPGNIRETMHIIRLPHGSVGWIIQIIQIRGLYIFSERCTEHQAAILRPFRGMNPFMSDQRHEGEGGFSNVDGVKQTDKRDSFFLPSCLKRAPNVVALVPTKRNAHKLTTCTCTTYLAPRVFSEICFFSRFCSSKMCSMMSFDVDHSTKAPL